MATIATGARVSGPAQRARVPAKVQVLRHLRVKHACPGCEQCVKSTPLPEQILAKTSACAGLLAHLVTSK